MAQVKITITLDDQRDADILDFLFGQMTGWERSGEIVAIIREYIRTGGKRNDVVLSALGRIEDELKSLRNAQVAVIQPQETNKGETTIDPVVEDNLLNLGT